MIGLHRSIQTGTSLDRVSGTQGDGILAELVVNMVGGLADHLMYKYMTSWWWWISNDNELDEVSCEWRHSTRSGYPSWVIQPFNVLKNMGSSWNLSRCTQWWMPKIMIERLWIIWNSSSSKKHGCDEMMWALSKLLNSQNADAEHGPIISKRLPFQLQYLQPFWRIQFFQLQSEAKEWL